MTDFIYWLGEALQWSFQILPKLGNGFNVVLLLIIAALSTYWTLQLVKFKKLGPDQE